MKKYEQNDCNSFKCICGLVILISKNVLMYVWRNFSEIFLFYEVKLTHPNWHGESNMRFWGGAHSYVLSQHDQANSNGLF
jgi:hypothetical protein